MVQALDRYFQSLGNKGALYPLGDSGTATGTPTAGSGALTTASYTLNWTALGNRIFYNGVVTITTNGTGATSVIVAAPSGYTPKEVTAGTGVDDGTRIQLSVRVDTSLGIALRKYDGTYPGADGKTLYFSGHYRF